MPSCGSCGVSVNESDNFCSKCGHKLIFENEQKELPEYVKKARLLYRNAYQTWSSEDDLKLKELYLQGKSKQELCDYFGRNFGAIRARIQKLGLE
ncbi:hypothetical protein GCM10011508_18810 [Flavobacterium lutivivi]|nr:hypothetical protein GCM10011508_18810 [Flavobacterium lutivivi]